MNMYRIAPIVCLLSIAFMVNAEVYKHVDSNGLETYPITTSSGSLSTAIIIIRVFGQSMCYMKAI